MKPTKKKFVFKKKDKKKKVVQPSYVGKGGAEELTKEEKRFVSLKCSGMETYRAYYKAFRKKPPKSQKERNTYAVRGRQKIIEPKISRAIIEKWQEDRKENDLDKKDVLYEIGRMVRANILDYVYFTERGEVRVDPEMLIDKDGGRVIQNLETTYDRQGRERLKIKMWSKERALDMLAKYHKMYADLENDSFDRRDREVIIIGNREISF